MDAQFAEQWNVENQKNPLCMKCLTGYVLLVGSFPVHGVSKLQLEIAVSMTEAAYIALSTALHNLISLRT